MEAIAVNYWAVLVGGVLAMVIGMIWYGFLFKGLWLRVIKADALDLEIYKNPRPAFGWTGGRSPSRVSDYLVKN